MHAPGTTVKITALKSQPDSDRALTMLQKIASVRAAQYRTNDLVVSTLTQLVACLSLDGETDYESSQLGLAPPERVLSQEPKSTRSQRQQRLEDLYPIKAGSGPSFVSRARGSDWNDAT